jgi:integrase
MTAIDMHGIEPLPSGKFRVRFVRMGRSVSKVVATIEEAVGLRNALREELASGEVLPLEGVSAARWGETWLRDFRGANRGFKTERGRFHLHVARAEWARKPLRAVEPSDIIRWLLKLQQTRVVQNGKTLKRTLGFQTRKHVRNLASALFADALSMGLCKTNPVLGVKVKKTATDRLVDRIPEEWPLKPGEQRVILDALKDDPERWIILFAIGTGVRQGEQWNLHLRDVHLDATEGPFVHVKFGSKGQPPKNGQPRKVPLFGVALEAARAWLECLPTYAPTNAEGLMFPTPHRPKREESGGRAYEGGARRQVGKTPAAWKKAKAVLGEREVWWHLLRHTAATSLLCGWWGHRWTLLEVSKFLGHSSVKVTERYAHLLESELASLAAQSHAGWLSRRSKGGSDGSSGAPSATPGSGSGATSPVAAAAAASGAAILFHGFSMNGSGRREILNDLAGTPGRIRTCDPRLRRPLLYPAELRAQTCASTAYSTRWGTSTASSNRRETCSPAAWGAPRALVAACHTRAVRSRSAFAMTDTELRLIAAAASIGLRSRPNAG